MKKRVFIAINLPEEIQNKISDFVKNLEVFDLPLRWVKKENFHLTLVFLGWLEESNVTRVTKVTKEITDKYHSFKLKIKDFGGFPNKKNPRVLWLGTEGDDDLIKLQKDLSNKLRDLKFEIKGREFSAHLTLGRTKEKIKNAEEIFKKFEKINLGEFEIKSIDIMESKLRRNGPIYKIIEEIKLKG